MNKRNVIKYWKYLVLAVIAVFIVDGIQFYSKSVRFDYYDSEDFFQITMVSFGSIKHLPTTRDEILNEVDVQRITRNTRLPLNFGYLKTTFSKKLYNQYEVAELLAARYGNDFDLIRVI